MGLFNSDATPKSAASAMETLINELAGAPFVRKEATPGNVYSMLFQRATGGQLRIMWSLSSRSVNLRGVTRAVDMLGNSLGTSGSYTLSDAPIFVEGSVTGVPAPRQSDEIILTTSDADFAGVQGYKGWTYGYKVGAGAFIEAPTYTSDAVSYTHLDVYKRQPSILSSGAAASSGFPVPTGCPAKGSVMFLPPQ